MAVLIGLDLGTTNCKALAFDAGKQLLASASLPTPQTDPSSRTSEYDAGGLWQISARLIRQVVDQLGPGQEVAAVAVASMGEAGVLVDAAGEPLFPVLTWHDRRTLPWVDWWRARLPDTAVYGITGLPQDYIYSAHKLLWYRDYDPAVFARARSWLGLADWVTYKLTGRPTTSYSMASRTMLFDLQARGWSAELLSLANLPPDLLPEPLASGQLAGRVTAAAAVVAGLPAGTPVYPGGHDHICAALAAGVIAPGTMLNSSGTTDTLLITLDEPLLDVRMANSGLCCGCHTARGRYYLVGGFMSGAVIGWLTRLLTGEDTPAALAPLLAEAGRVAPGAGGTWFVPYLAGSGPPDRDPNTWGAWLGLRLQHTRGDLVRATLEGLSFAMRYLLEVFEGVAGSTTHELRAVGGGSRNELWLAIKADVLGRPVEVPDVSDVTARGAALLAGIGAGIYADEHEAAARAYRPVAAYVPDPQRQAAYEAAYRDVFSELRRSLARLPITPSP
jgi:xylulokinase